MKKLLAVLLFLAIVPAVQSAPTRDKTPLDNNIDRALEFLHNTQDKATGAWRVRSSRHPAITALCVMSFLSSGHVPGEGKYGATIEKGIRFVLQSQKSNGLIASSSGHEMYHHGICSLMLAEVIGMTDGPLADEVRRALEKAVVIILKAQRVRGSERGGWRYSMAHSGGSDISVTGWQVLALRGAKNLGCDVPRENIESAVDFIQRCRDRRSGAFRYTPSGGVTVPCTGTSILALELCGKNLHRSPELLKAGAYLLKHPPRWGQSFFYYMIYYCSQATFQLGNNYWDSFRPKMHEVLFRYQKSNGSWQGGGSDSQYGPQYSTAMAVLALTVEYRFLPIYQRGEEPEEK